MTYSLLAAFALYFLLLAFVALISYQRKEKVEDFLLGSRRSSYWLTAISAHASDMSSWLFMGLPAAIFVGGSVYCWAALGLLVFMFFNWHFVARPIRELSEQTNSLTLPALFEASCKQKSSSVRAISALVSLFFYSFYISSGLIGMGYLFESVFSLDYHLSLLFSLAFIMIYTFVGGYTTVIWTDFFQGIFLLLVLLYMPAILLLRHDFSSIASVAQAKGISLLPSYSFYSIFEGLFTMLAWGLGYFGQPHILNKFMGIKDPKEMSKSKILGMTWHFLSLTAALAVGYLSIVYFDGREIQKELVFVEMVKENFTAFWSGFVLCSILAASISTIDSQILVLSSVLSEDLYKMSFRGNASSKELLWVSRISVILICLLAYFIAGLKSQGIYELVLYAWSGLGASFGPLLLLLLYFRKLSSKAMLSCMCSGAILSALWEYFSPLAIIPSIVPAFFISLLLGYLFK